jgi:hypothetical protein
MTERDPLNPLALVEVYQDRARYPTFVVRPEVRSLSPDNRRRLLDALEDATAEVFNLWRGPGMLDHPRDKPSGGE